MKSPNSGISAALSMIPFFSPILMLKRTSIILPPFSQVAGSIALLVVTTVGMI